MPRLYVEQMQWSVATSGQAQGIKVEPVSALQRLGDHAVAKRSAQEQITGREEEGDQLFVVMQAQWL
jgi:hypothetical protein